ncbi:hypothetical protein HDU82_002823 [Entophlyctis luteolus]|nr:hypothetical protein HDU82_002823 [Entophlyctis luteolus]
MTFVTVLVQHAWAMQPSTSAAQHPAPGQTGETAQTLPSGKKSGHRAIVPKIPTVRVSVPASVAEFVAVFNAVHALDATIAAGSGDVRADVIAAAVDRADAKARDVLARLEDLVLASSIRLCVWCVRVGLESVPVTCCLHLRKANERVRTRPRTTGDARRHDAMREAARARKAAWYKPRKGAAGGAGGADAGAGSDGRGPALRIQTRRYAAQARRSLLVLASARSRMLRRNCLALLVEALDTNELGFDDAEVASQLLLVKEMGDMLESALSARRQQKAQAEPAEEQAISDAITVDNFLEAIATFPADRTVQCISLAVQRLEYACDIKPFFIPTEMRSAFQRLFNENLCLLETNDLFAAQVISGAIETVHWLMRAKVETEELMATPVGLSLLSRITRMTPGLDIRGMLGAFTGILRDLKDKQEWCVHELRLKKCRKVD